MEIQLLQSIQNVSHEINEAINEADHYALAIKQMWGKDERDYRPAH